jgi:hypothetical protein
MKVSFLGGRFFSFVSVETKEVVISFRRPEGDEKVEVIELDLPQVAVGYAEGTFSFSVATPVATNERWDAFCGTRRTVVIPSSCGRKEFEGAISALKAIAEEAMVGHCPRKPRR